MEKIPYIVKKRMRLEGIGGRVNLPYGTRLEAVDGVIIHKGAAIHTSQISSEMGPSAPPPAGTPTCTWPGTTTARGGSGAP